VKCFGKDNASAHKLRYEKTYNLLDYLDSLSLDQSELVLSTLTKFADTHDLTHSSLVKQVFYLMVRPDSLKPKGVEVLCEGLLSELKLIEVPLPKLVQKQVHNCNFNTINQND